jgi:hypothetical protein
MCYIYYIYIGGVFMGGRRIDDRSSWIGTAPKGEAFPIGNKVKHYPDSDGVGHLDNYQDTAEAVHSFQSANRSKAMAHRQPDNHRN